MVSKNCQVSSVKELKMNNFFGILPGERMALKITLSFVCLVLLSQAISAQNTYTTYSQ